MKHNQKKINNFFFAIFALFLILGAAVPAAAETSIVWSQEIGNVAAADMSEDGQTIYAAVGSQVYIYDAAGVEQNVLSVGGTVVKLVSTADGTRAALYTDGEEVYYIDNGALTWSQSFTAITDIDISNAGSVLVVESGVFHKFLRDGTLEYNSSSGTYNLGVIDPDDEFAIIQSGTSGLQKYLLTTTDQYWGKVGDNSFNTNFSDFQGLVVFNQSSTSPIKIDHDSPLWDIIYTSQNTSERYYAISDDSLVETNAYNYNRYIQGAEWQQVISAAPWSKRSCPFVWVFNNKMWLAGGELAGYSRVHDVWFTEDGSNWTQATSAAPWSARHGGVSWTYDHKMWLAGGYSNNDLNDVWFTEDGSNWTQATSAAPWSARRYALSWNYKNKMWIGGGQSNTNFNDIWFTEDGSNWTQATSTAWSSGISEGSAFVFNDKMWAVSYSGAVWSSEDGSNWTQTTSSIWGSGSASGASWVINNRVYVASATEVWSSEDGSNWTQTTSSAPWKTRTNFGYWCYNDKLWIGGGYVSVTSRLNDVWVSNTDSISIDSGNIGEIYLFYSYTGTSPQHTQTTYANPVSFTGTTELRTKPTLSIYDLQTTKTLNGNIAAISLSDRGDWLGTATTTRIYHDQITSGGFGTEYYAGLGSTGTVYDVATANSAAMSILGQGQTTDIYSMSTARVGTYTAGGAVQYVDIAAKNALWATSGGADGKVYIFSKDESSNWYLEYSSDSEDPITALKMSSRGEFVLAGRTRSLTLYQTNTPEQTDTNFWFTLYIYKDSDSYRQAAVNVSVYNINNQWQSFAEGLTDSSGKYVLQLTAGNTYKFDVANGQKVLVYQAAPSVPSQVISIHSSPVSAALTYEAEWDPEIGGVTFDYMDSTGQTQTVIVKIIRTDTWETVYEQTYTGQQSIEQSVPIVDDTVGYKVELSASRSSGITRNTWFVSSSRDIVPIPLDTNVKNILFSCFLIFLAGLFSYLSAFRGAIVVCLSAIFFTYMGWLTIPWHWLVVAVVLAFVAGFTQRRT